jgi:hypothetical protein
MEAQAACQSKLAFIISVVNEAPVDHRRVASQEKQDHNHLGVIIPQEPSLAPAIWHSPGQPLMNPMLNQHRRWRLSLNKVFCPGPTCRSHPHYSPVTYLICSTCSPIFFNRSKVAGHRDTRRNDGSLPYNSQLSNQQLFLLFHFHPIILLDIVADTSIAEL